MYDGAYSSAGTRLPHLSRRARLHARRSASVPTEPGGIPPDLQKGVRQCYFFDILHQRVIEEIAVDKEKDGQVDLLAREQPLLFKAEALYFGKVRGDLEEQRETGQRRVSVR